MLNVDVRAREILREIGGIPKLGVEVGVYTGRLSKRLLADPSLRLFLVDPWRAMESKSYKETDDFHHRMSQQEHDKAMQQTLVNVKPFADRVVIIREPSIVAASEFENSTLDFVFIDGDHSYEGCNTDILAWWPKIRKGGFLSGHDYRDDMGFGVKQAVHGWLGDRQLRLGDNFTWFVSKWD